MPARLHLFLLRLYRQLPVQLRRRVVRYLSPSYTVGSMCFIERADGAMLFVRHSYRRRWGVPGGLLKRRESPKHAAVRETFEETGVTIETVGQPAVVIDPVAQRVDLAFDARLVGADIAQAEPRSPEILECRWFRPDELPELQHETREALEALARRRLASVTSPAFQDVGLRRDAG